ncbi:helix-turn-helix transcriptional regulator [Vibrio cholerae]|nr:helix-turn-helix transcriptional regulator [Vibrio cholerae]EHS1094230.1 helix-turn-helix transcriptional regulator [Vibrio cholerae]EJH6265727.1 helix-turn-helix transcriptional regulator [Vibrio cholerae]EJL6420260.1 helix-turn-helix transcriptional regulator [Vibrio cholerae]EJL6499641.1 helix-turn-helix transcriptional regulator [Vibrio cholerae]
MELNQEDRRALYDVWMTKKAKMHMTQMEMTKRLGVSQGEFSELLRGDAPLSMSFVSRFCQHLHVEPHNVLPTLKRKTRSGEKLVHLQNRVTVDGDIKRVYVEGNQVIIEYTHLAK